MRRYGYFRRICHSDFISLPYVSFACAGNAGSTLYIINQQYVISPAAMKYTMRHPQALAISPLSIREPKIPTNRQDCMMPTLRVLWLGAE